MERVIYLDTHSVVWLYAGSTGLFSKKALAALEASQILISPMVALELQYLFETGRVRASSGRIVAGLTADINLKVCEIPFAEVAARALEQKWTRDPFDRIIAAQAIAGNAPLLTKDATILKNCKRAFWD